MNDVARQAGVARSTVSRALRNAPSIPQETCQRIQALAAQMGYKLLPVVSAFMRYRVHAKKSLSSEVLAFVSRPLGSSPSSLQGWNRRLWNGMEGEAQERGYRIEPFPLRPGWSSSRLSQILFARGIRGVIIGPLYVSRGHLRLDWEKFSAVSIGYTLHHPILHRVVPDRFNSIALIMQKLKQLRYRRIGLAVRSAYDQGANRHISGAFLALQQRWPTSQHIPPLICRQWKFSNFSEWFHRYRPEVILGRGGDVLAYLQKLGLHIPNDVGYVSLNRDSLTPNTQKVCAVDQNPEELGAQAIRLLITLMDWNQKGVPRKPFTVSTTFSWQDGETLRAMTNP